MDLNLNTNAQNHREKQLRGCVSIPNEENKRVAYQSCYFNISAYKYDIITNRQKVNTLSMPKLITDGTKAHKLKTFLQYWNNENFFDPVRNSKEKFDNIKGPLVKKKSEYDMAKYAKTTPLPVIKVLKAHEIQKHRRSS